MSDDFATDYTTRKDLGPDWPIYYEGPGGGSSTPARVRLAGRTTRSGFCSPRGAPRLPDRSGMSRPTPTTRSTRSPSAHSRSLRWCNDIWLRMGRNPDGSWNGFGVRRASAYLTVELDLVQQPPQDAPVDLDPVPARAARRSGAARRRQ